MVASVINFAKWITLATIIFGEKASLWQTLNVPPPSAYTWSQGNKIVSCLSVFFLSNTIEGALLQTGAFEIELNGTKVWSKLQTGRIPQGEELFQIIQNRMNPSGASPPQSFSPPQSSTFGDFQEKEKYNTKKANARNGFEEFDTEEHVEL